MKLFVSGRAPNPRRVQVFLAEKGASIPTVDVDILKMDHKTPEFTASVNALQRIPVLELDDGTMLAESVAICRYLEGLYPEPNLFGRDFREQAFVEMWNRRAELELLLPVAMVFRHSHPGMATLEVPQVGAWAEVNRPRVLRALGIFNDHLANSQFLAGDRFSIADITAMIAVDFLKPSRIPIPEDLAHLRRWHAECTARPSAKA